MTAPLCQPNQPAGGVPLRVVPGQLGSQNGAKPLTPGTVALKSRQRWDSYRFALAPEEVAWLDLLPTVARCLFCAETFEGTAAEAIAWGSDHRKQQHPEKVQLTTGKMRKAAAKAGV